MLGYFRLPSAPVRRASPPPAARGPQTEAQWLHHRAPLRPQDEALSRMALTWLDLLPAHTQPLALCGRYPRIANRLAVCWADPVLTDLVLDDLLIDRRGGRQGFPAPVLADLLALRELHERRPRVHAAEDPWSQRLQASCDR